MAKKHGGPNCELTELRAKTAEMLGKGIGQVCKLTKGWTAPELYEMYRKAQEGKNAPALWWWLRKEFIKKNEETIQKRIKARVEQRVLQDWKTKKTRLQKTLF